jgi:hypothetical protein
MASSKKLKKAARERMKRTGERYTTARMEILKELGLWPEEKPTEVVGERRYMERGEDTGIVRGDG